MHNQKINSIKKEIKKVKRDIEELENDDTQNVDKNKYEKRLEHIEKAIKLRENWAESANYWYDLLAPKSLLRSTIICKYINILSDIFEYYMSKLYNNEILSKIEIDDSGQIDFILYKDNFEINYWQMSSGERKRIDIAMILSLYEFTSHLNPNIPKFMILDEIYDSLDYPGIEAVTQTLIDVQKRHNIDLYIISHIPLPLEDIDESVDLRRILVTKKDKVSSAQFVD
jgi:DNA repair exonuclease SbcCD ATPase subunit